MIKSIKRHIIKISILTVFTHMIVGIAASYVSVMFYLKAQEVNAAVPQITEIRVSNTPSNDIVEYIIQPGDHLSSIAKKQTHLDLTPYTIAAINNIKNANKIEVGDTLNIRYLNKKEIGYLLQTVMPKEIVDSELVSNLSDTIYNETMKANIDPMIVLGIFGAESGWNPFLTAMYVTLPNKSNLPPRFTKLQKKIVIPYNCASPRRYTPDIGGMQLSYGTISVEFDLDYREICRLHYDPSYNMKKAIELLTIKRRRYKKRFGSDWYLTYHNKDKTLMRFYEKSVQKRFITLQKELTKIKI